ncbi:MAG: prepilin-type N-terminal cleavage/methylation domain-containing protein [Rubrivivax sp.]|nr:prepilin-type N-terminal cleavage/methylation domain-containing protein [Rubrivivax sp.]
MPTSAPGSSVLRHRAWPRCGLTLIELVIVVAIVAVATAVVMVALRDGDEARLEEEAARLAALLEMARAESRVSGASVLWVPQRDEGAGPSQPQFRFIGLSDKQPMPGRWLDAATRADVVGGSTVLLGPEAILPPQRIVLRLAAARLELASDGLGPFAVAAAAPAP